MKHFGKRIAALAVSAMTLVASFAGCTATVSYTHLTLPTNREV